MATPSELSGRADAEQSSVKPVVLLVAQLAAADTGNFEELGRVAAVTKAVATTLPPSELSLIHI